jgi:hypothetical protein
MKLFYILESERSVNDYIWFYEKGPDKKHEGDMVTFTGKAGKEK